MTPEEYALSGTIMLSTPVAILKFGGGKSCETRIRRCLAEMNIFKLGDLIQKREDDLTSHSGFGRKSINYVKYFLAENGMSLGMTIEAHDA